MTQASDILLPCKMKGSVLIMASELYNVVKVDWKATKKDGTEVTGTSEVKEFTSVDAAVQVHGEADVLALINQAERINTLNRDRGAAARGKTPEEIAAEEKAKELKARLLAGEDIRSILKSMA
jgi:hypothetical protein